MDYQIKKLPKSEVELTITVPEEIMETARKKAADDLSHKVKVDGFRPGHVPYHVLEQKVGKNMLEAHAQELAIQRSYAEVATKEKLQVIARPKVEIETQSPLKYKATVATMPEVEVKDYKSIKIKKEEVKVTDKDVQEVIDDVLKHHTSYKDVEREVKKGDRVEVDFEGFDGDKAVENTKSQNHPVVIGENTLIPGFEDELIGLKKDEKKEFDITFPKDYHQKDFQGRKLTFKVEVKRVEEPEKAVLNEEMIEKLTGKKQSEADFRKEVEANIKARKEEETKQKEENEYVEALLKKTKVEIPDSLIAEEAHAILHDMKDEVGRKGMEFEQFLEQSKTTEEELLKKYHPEAERRITMRLALQQVIKEEKIELSDKEVKDELEKVKGFYPAEQHEKIQEDFEKGELGMHIKNRLILRKFFAKVLDRK